MRPPPAFTAISKDALDFSGRTCGNVVAPLFTRSTPLPDSASPRISYATISVMEKQSCTSAPCRSRGVRFAIRKAFSAALRAIGSEIGIAHLRERIQLCVRIIFPRDSSQVCFGRAVFLDVNLCDASEQFWEHEIAILRLFVVIIGCRAEHIGPVEGRHRFLLL